MICPHGDVEPARALEHINDKTVKKEVKI